MFKGEKFHDFLITLHDMREGGVGFSNLISTIVFFGSINFYNIVLQYFNEIGEVSKYV